MSAGLVGALSAAGMFLATVGLYAVIAYVVNRRTREMGVRMALGAQTADVQRLVLGYAIKLTLAGSVIGVCAALAVNRLMAGSLYGVKPNDPITLAAACSAILLTALMACYAPARRASNVDPMVALRSE
jgi:putative ABC transport system permease protein